MSDTFIRVQSAQKSKPRQRTRRTALSLFIGGLFYSAAPAWADCSSEGANANGGLNITCEGEFNFATGVLGDSNNNSVTAQGNNTIITGNTYGGYISSYINNAIIVTNNNEFNINDNAIADADVYGGYAYTYGYNGSVTSNNNTVNINNNATVHGNLYSGYAYGNRSTATVVGNVVNVNNDATVRTVFAGYAYIYQSSAIITDNIANINDNASVVGDGRVHGAIIYNDGDSSSTLKYNIVNLNNSARVEGSVVGGYIYSRKAISSSGNVNAIFNTVNINDNASPEKALYGGFLDYAGTTPAIYDVFTGNTLNFAAAPITLSGEVANFENYNFILDPTLVNTDTALITANTITFGTNEANMKGGEDNTSKIQVVGIKAGNELFADDKFVLMQATGTMSGNEEVPATHGVAQQGISLLYDVRTDVDTDGKLVTATILNNKKPEKPVDPVEPPIDPVEPPVEPGKPAARVNPQLKSLSEGHLASAMMLTRGADTLAYNTVHTIQHQNPDKGLAPFITLSGDKTRYNSGSHIDAKDGRLTGGLGYQTDKLTGAVMIESGWGSYNTHNSFDTMNDVNGDGHSRYTGAAVLGHYDFDSGIYAEASLRAGKNRNAFDTRDIVNLSTGERAHYNLDSNYLGAHIGTGYSKALDEKNTADVSAKYLWTQLKGKDVTVAGDKIHFDDINSQRIRLDAGLSHQYTEAVAMRAGLGYEYEFDGKAKASTYGYDIAAPGVQGSTAVLTLGSTVKPLAAQPLSVDFNVNGYTGKRDGVGGSIKFSYAF